MTGPRAPSVEENREAVEGRLGPLRDGRSISSLHYAVEGPRWAVEAHPAGCTEGYRIDLRIADAG